MSYKYQVLSLQERGQLLIAVVVFILIGALFFGTAFLIDRIFPGMPSSIDFEGQGFPPGVAVFMSLAAVCAILAAGLLGTALFNTLAFLYLPLIFFGVAGIGAFFVSLFNSFAQGGFLHGIVVLGILGVEAAAITWILSKLANWYDERHGYDPRSLFDKYQAGKENDLF